MKKLFAWIGLGLLLPLMLGCDAEARTGGGKLRIVATTTMVGDLVRQIAGDVADLTVIMGPGVDPHTYKPSTSDLGAVAKADLIFYNGLHLEGKMVELFEHKLADRSVAVTSGIPQDRLLSWKEGQGGAHDPHVWFDVRLWAMAAGAVRDRLMQASPEHAEMFRQRGDALVAKLESLDADIRARIETLEPEKRVLITSHDAYSYFGRAYGFEVLGIQGISTETEAAVPALRAAVDYIVTKQIPAIFVESSVPPATIERVKADCAARGFEVKIGGELYSDAMGTPGEHPGYAVETYEGMVRYNVDTIVSALKGESK